ncbi:polysaccharide deacetylase family protein [bacterium]|nr:polysaccharide deacetylase family protein [bacterium]
MIKRGLRQAGAALAMGLCRRRVVGKGEALVLRYCRVGGTREEPLPRAVSEEEFEGHLRFLTTRCRVMPLADIVSALAEERPLPPQAVAITFDGGYEDNGSRAFLLLKQYGVPATFFVAAGWVETHDVLWWDRIHAFIQQTQSRGICPTGFEVLPDPVSEALAAARDGQGLSPAKLEDWLVQAVGSLQLTPENTDDLVKSIGRSLGAEALVGDTYDPMNWEQLAILRDGGMTIGSNAVSDARLTTVNVERAFEELAFSKRTLESRLGCLVDLMAYPEGCHSLDVADLAEEAGYRAAFTTDSGPLRRGDNPFALRRLDACGGDCRGLRGRFSPSIFAQQLRRAAHIPPPVVEEDEE